MNKKMWKLSEVTRNHYGCTLLPKNVFNGWHYKDGKVLAIIMDFDWLLWTFRIKKDYDR